MKTNLTRRKLLYFLIHRMYGGHAPHAPGLTISRLKKIDFELENTLRWEDDGGQSSDRNWVARQKHPAATRAHKIMRIFTAADFDALGSKKSKIQAYKDEYLVNDSLGG